MKTKKFFCLAMVVLCVFSLILPATAARYASKSTKEYGMLRGDLGLSRAWLFEGRLGYYEFSFSTEIDHLPTDMRNYDLIAKVTSVNNATGAYIDSEVGMHLPEDSTRAGYYLEMDQVPGIRGKNGITIGVFGAHEVRGPAAYAIYTSATYNLYRDHGII